MANEPEKVYSSTRFGCEPGEEDITINYFSNRRFEVRGKDIAGPLIFATDDSLDPDVPKGAKLLVNERQTTVDSGGYYVFRNANGGNSFDIALVEPLEDGTYRYVFDRKNPQILSDLSDLSLVGRVCEVQTQIEIEEFETPANSGLSFDEKARKKVQVWWPIWTEITPVASNQTSLSQ